jgi:hypothetical protein
MYIRNDCGAKVASKVKVKVKGAEVISIMNSMGRSCPLLWCKYESKLSPIMTACTTWVLTMFSEILMLDVLICLCVLMGKSYLYIYIYISIRLFCIWFEWCLVWMCLYTYVYSLKLWNIYMLLWPGYDVNNFHIWLMLCLDVPVYLYSPKLWNIYMLV